MTSALSSNRASSASDGAIVRSKLPVDADSSAAVRAGSAVSSSGTTLLTSVTLRSAAASARAATHPSPPLLPEPARMTIVAPGAACASTARARAVPARVMSSKSDVPSRAMRCSSATTSATSSTGACAMSPSTHCTSMVRCIRDPSKSDAGLASLSHRTDSAKMQAVKLRRHHGRT